MEKGDLAANKRFIQTIDIINKIKVGPSSMRQPRATYVGINFNNTVFLKDRLRNEITKLERQLQTLRLSEDAANFSMVQTYKEMIKYRQLMLSDLPR